MKIMMNFVFSKFSSTHMTQNEMKSDLLNTDGLINLGQMITESDSCKLAQHFLNFI
jgi:hypothetical protein